MTTGSVEGIAKGDRGAETCDGVARSFTRIGFEWHKTNVSKYQAQQEDSLAMNARHMLESSGRVEGSPQVLSLILYD